MLRNNLLSLHRTIPMGHTAIYTLLGGHYAGRVCRFAIEIKVQACGASCVVFQKVLSKQIKVHRVITRIHLPFAACPTRIAFCCSLIAGGTKNWKCHCFGHCQRGKH
mmetsp:Transcript_52479/g.147317  ORF Transcript_52479/g.147317 Transcript_52479/m.147317 type:complete len:107 (-) Transcript_52479:97-417(-)